MKLSTERQAEIDRRVAQELKNNQDFICTTNQWLQKLDLALERMKKEFLGHAADVGSKLKAQDISIENLSDDHKAHQKKCSQDLEEYRKQMSFCLQFVQESVKRSDERFVSLQQCNDAILALKDRVVVLAQEIDRIDQLIHHEALRLSNQITAKSDALKNEILNLPTEIPSLKQMISDKISVFQVDFQGIVRELEIIKKKAFISSKYIEELYNKFDRLKEVKK